MKDKKGYSFIKSDKFLYLQSDKKKLNMKTKSLFLLFALMIPCLICAEATKNIVEVLDELDEVINSKQIYELKQEERIAALKARLHGSTDVRERYELCDDLFEAYLHYQADSSLAYVNKKLELLPSLGYSEYGHEVVINKAEIMGVMGLYSEAVKLLDTVNPALLNTETLGYYYRTKRACYGWWADYVAFDELKEYYLAKTNLYRDSIMLTDVVDRDIVEAEKYMLDGNEGKALTLLKAMLANNPGIKQQAYINYTLSEVYDIRGDIERQIYHLAITALIDLKTATKEYASLQQLAFLMYQKGDVYRAYRYLQCSMEDAVFCNARLRFFEVSQLLPIIEKAYKQEEERSKMFYHILLVAACVFSLALVYVIIWLYRWNKKLTAMRLSLSEANRKLQVVNQELAQTGKIKEAYIAHYLDQCVAYLDKLETYRRSLAKLAMASRIDDLFKAIKSEQFIRDERRDFYRNFDEAFLDLYPNFIDSFNDLLVDEGKVYPKSNELLNTELRIFALIRLGVTDSNSIAHFLGYSLATVYNYRSKIRNRAKSSKDTFEQEVMSL